MSNKKIFVVGGVVAAILLLLLFFILVKPENVQTVQKVGFIIPGSTTEGGYNGTHYNGLKEACDYLGAKLYTIENAVEYTGRCEDAVEKMKKDGIGMVVLGSFNYPDEMADAFGKYQDMSFFCSSTVNDINNLSLYCGRMYQGRYLAGVLAGLSTKNNKLGYVAAMDNSEVNRGINAFTLGAKSVNPDITVFVKYTGSWDDEPAEKAAVKELIENNDIDLVTYHANQPHVVDEAEKQGIMSIGYHEYIKDKYSPNCLAAVECDWSMIYRELVSDYLKGNGNIKQMYWLGLENDAVKLEGYSSKVSNDMKSAIEEASNRIISGHDVFMNEIYDNEGKLRCAQGEAIDDATIFEHMDWLVEGIIIND